jgi:hypothetical protein
MPRGISSSPLFGWCGVCGDEAMLRWEPSLCQYVCQECWEIAGGEQDESDG